MKNLFKGFWIVSLAALIVTAPLSASTLKAAPLKPSVVISISSIDDALDNYSRLAKFGGNGEDVQMLRLMLSMYTVGIDTEKPIGIAVRYKKTLEADILAFVPVTDLKTQLTALRDQIGEPEELENGILGLQVPLLFSQHLDIYVKKQGNWAFVATSKDLLKNLPGRPTTMLGDLHKKYDIGVRFNIRNTPKAIREMMIDGVSQSNFAGPVGLFRGMWLELPAKYKRGRNVNKELADLQKQDLRRLAEDVKSLTLGLTIDKNEEASILEVEMETIKDSRTAKKIALMEKMNNPFAGFVSADAAVTCLFSSRQTEDEIKQSVQMLTLVHEVFTRQFDKNSPPDMPEGFSKLLDDIFDILKSNAQAGSLDMAASVTLNSSTTCLIGAATVADAKKVENTIRKIAKIAEEKNDDFPKVKYNAASYKGVKFHKIEAPVKENDLKKLLGEKVDIYIGLGKGVGYIAAGKNSLDTLKKAIDDSEGKKVVIGPFAMKVRGEKVADFVATRNENPITAAWAEALSETPDNDSFSVKATVKGTTLKYRIQLDDGIIRAAGRAQQAESDL